MTTEHDNALSRVDYRTTARTVVARGLTSVDSTLDQTPLRAEPPCSEAQGTLLKAPFAEDCRGTRSVPDQGSSREIFTGSRPWPAMFMHPAHSRSPGVVMASSPIGQSELRQEHHNFTA
jgi:hypothetical protein